VFALVGVLWIPVFVWLAAGTLFGARQPALGRPPVGLWTLLLTPFVIPLYGTVGYGWAKGPSAPAWPTQVLIGLVVSQVVLVFCLSWRYRHRPEFTILTALAALAFIGVAFVISAMAVADVWI
jgi:hypothetical protein